MAVFKPRLRFHCISRKKDALCSLVIKRIYSMAKGAMSIILTLICKMVTILRVMRECCDGGCDSNETGRDKAHLTGEWSFQIKTIIIIEAWPWWRASSLSFFIVPIQKYIIGMIFENICNEGGRDTLLIIITTSALTNVSFTLCCLLKNTDTWGVTHSSSWGGGRDFFLRWMSLSVIELFESLLRMMHAQSSAENKALKSSKVHFND